MYITHHIFRQCGRITPTFGLMSPNFFLVFLLSVLSFSSLCDNSSKRHSPYSLSPILVFSLPPTLPKNNFIRKKILTYMTSYKYKRKMSLLGYLPFLTSISFLSLFTNLIVEDNLLFTTCTFSPLRSESILVTGEEDDQCPFISYLLLFTYDRPLLHIFRDKIKKNKRFTFSSVLVVVSFSSFSFTKSKFLTCFSILCQLSSPFNLPGTFLRF